MNRANNRTPIPHGPPSDILEPTLDRFYWSWFEGFDSTFNQEALRLLVNYTITAFSGEFTEDDRLSLTEAAKTHMLHLRNTYLQQFDGEDLETRERLEAKVTRKCQVSPEGRPASGFVR